MIQTNYSQAKWKMKLAIEEFVGLKPKPCLVDGNSEHKKAKGLDINVAEK